MNFAEYRREGSTWHTTCATKAFHSWGRPDESGSPNTLSAFNVEVEQSMMHHVLKARARKISCGVICGSLTLLAMAPIAQAQEPTSPAPVFRQSMNDAWWTGPMLAPSASTLPRGHFLIEPYLYDVITQGFFDSKGARISAPHTNGFGSLTYINYGLTNRVTVGVIPTFGYNQVSNGPSSAGVGVGDLTVQAQYRLHLFQEHSWIPTISFAVQQTLPTGRYDRLGNRPSDGIGGGAFTTVPSLYTQTFFWMPNGRILRMRLNVAPAFSHSVNVQDVSVYGTTQGFRGHAKPGASIFVGAAWEYSLTRRWVLALDATFRHQGNTPVTGYSVLSPNPATIQLNSGLSDSLGLAPAIEYNWKSNVGVLLGVRFIPAGRNTSATITPALAINFVH